MATERVTATDSSFNGVSVALQDSPNDFVIRFDWRQMDTRANAYLGKVPTDRNDGDEFSNSEPQRPRPLDVFADQWSKRPYPLDLVHEVVTDDGLTLCVRPIRPDDAELLIRFHARLSSDSIFRRYFSLHPELSAPEIRRLTQVDYVERFAFVVQHDGELLGVGRFDRIRGTPEAEVAFIVADGYHRRGIGLLLLDRLTDEAWSLGITLFSAETQADNRGMMGVFRASGFLVHSMMDDEVITARFSIEPTEESQASRSRREHRFHSLPQSRDDHS
jgi:RimJ/RimL family protein N-acetyltransferase